MPHISALRESKYLRKEDVPKPILLTVKTVVQENLAMEGQPIEYKWVMHFMENVKAMVLNSTNAQLAAAALGSEVTEDWCGRKLVVFTDPSVSYQGKLIGGLRVRAPRNQPASTPVQQPPSPPPTPDVPPGVEEDPGDEVPF